MIQHIFKVKQRIQFGKIQYDLSSVDSKCKPNECISRNTTYGSRGITF